MEIILPLILIFSGSFFSAVFFKKNVEESIPITIMSIILFLYIFYCFDKLLLGFYLVIFVCTCMYLSLIYLIKKNGFKQSWIYLKKYLVTPPLIIFIILCIIFFIITRNNTVMLWDELRLWGAYPKVLFYTDKLQLGNYSYLFPIMRSHTPGMPLFVYFIEKFNRSFSEPNIFFAYAIFCSSLFMPALKKLKWKSSYLIIPISFIIFLIPLVFYNSYLDMGDYYKSIYIDPVLGLLIAYNIYLLSTNSFENWFKTFRLILAISILALIKDTGLIIAMVIIITSLFLEIFLYKNKLSYKNTKKHAFRICIGLGVPLMVTQSWNIMLKLYHIHGRVQGDIFSYFHWTPFIKTFIIALFNKPIMNSNFNIINQFLCFIPLYVLILILSIFIIRLYPKIKRQNLYISLIVQFMVSCVIIAGLYVFCVGAFEENFFSFERYVNTILVGNFGYTAILLFNIIFDNSMVKPKSKLSKIFISTFITILIIVFPLRYPKVFDGNWNGEAAQNAKIISDYIYKDIGDFDNTINVFIVFKSDINTIAGLHHRIYFDLIEKHILIKNFCDETNITSQNNNEISNKNREFQKVLINKQYDYVYIAEEDSLLGEQFKSFFGKDVKKGDMYKIIQVNGNLRLKKL